MASPEIRDLSACALTAYLQAADDLLCAQRALLGAGMLPELQALIDEYVRRCMAVLDLRADLARASG